MPKPRLRLVERGVTRWGGSLGPARASLGAAGHRRPERRHITQPRAWRILDFRSVVKGGLTPVGRVRKALACPILLGTCRSPPCLRNRQAPLQLMRLHRRTSRRGPESCCEWLNVSVLGDMPPVAPKASALRLPRHGLEQPAAARCAMTPSAAAPFTQALPADLGGKRRLAPLYFAALQAVMPAARSPQSPRHGTSCSPRSSRSWQART